MLRDDRGVDAPADVEACLQAHEPGLRCPYEVLQDVVGDGLVERANVAIGPDVELERFQLDAKLVGHVVEQERREVRLAGHRANAGELRDLHVDPVVTPARWIRKSLQLFAGTRRHWLGKKPPRKEARKCYHFHVRLTQIKLSGFKSFVDPTTIHVPGQLVGVVGPNGCGKSNVIDAVRWVLGESRAAALRGDSMQDVIFNGSVNRQALARASVELSFDNSLGRAAGQWSQYAEISVRRVLQRDGESSYYINGTHVRRRDITDMFLGTGLGPRAYAIIEQGMISRVIEAKPEELRVFLEEAAGISKYKERRRETENRLSDTRENLARVTDIRAELGLQIEKLEAQAQVANRYKEYRSDLQLKQQLLWYLRRRDAATERERHAKDIARTTNDLEAEIARLREIESRLEASRAAHYQAGDSMNAAQAALYAANAEVARHESELRHIEETRQRLESRYTERRTQLSSWREQRSELTQALHTWAARAATAKQRLVETQARLAGESAKLPQTEESFRLAQDRLGEARSQLLKAESRLQLEQSNVAHLGRNIQSLEQRRERLQGELETLAKPDVERLAALATLVRDADASIGEAEAGIE